MQVVQNKCSRIITKTRLREQKTSKSINEKAKLEPINQTLHERAKAVWDKIEMTNNQKQKMIFKETYENCQFKSSRRLCQIITIDPIY